MAQDTITIQAWGLRHVAPEVAAWRLFVAVRHAEPRAAFDGCAEKAAHVVERLKSVADVETGTVSVQPYEEPWTPDGGGRSDDHQATIVVVARVPVARAAEVADAAMSAGADRLVGPQLSLDDPAAAELEALEEAVGDARRRAERLAATAGRPLGRIVSIDTEELRVAEMRSGGSDLPVEPGDIAVQAHATVVFAFAD